MPSLKLLIWSSKSFLLKDRAGEFQVQGHYALANLLQELFLAKQRGQTELHVDVKSLLENPVARLERFIKTMWWDNLTRHMDKSGIVAASKDPKTKPSRPRIYVPPGAPRQYDYYSKIAKAHPEMDLDVQWLPKGEIKAEFIRDLNLKPGILCLDMDYPMEDMELNAVPYIVPGDRFNELYNWDSVFAGWGMLESHPRLVKSIIKNFAFQIQHYGKVLNANRTYYLGRAQPPFLTDLALKTYEKTKSGPTSKPLLKRATLAAMKEYHEWWMTEPRLDKKTGLSRYRPIGLGLPPECEPGHFKHILAPYAAKYKMTIEEVLEAYTNGDIIEPDLDTFSLHDRAVRESGHDVSNRVEGVCADLATVDLNCLLYKYEKDFAHIIRDIFNDHLPGSDAFQAANGSFTGTSADWEYAASKRKTAIDKYLWNESKGFYFDYNTHTHQQTTYESVTTFWAPWSGVASPSQAQAVIDNALPKFECTGGLSVSTESSRGPIDESHPQKQWDYPYGWPPHQLLAWEALEKYGFVHEKERLVYRWLYMMTRVFRDFNGTVVEKYDVTKKAAGRPHCVDAEYGNQGSHFMYAPQEG